MLYAKIALKNFKGTATISHNKTAYAEMPEKPCQPTDVPKVAICPATPQVWKNSANRKHYVCKIWLTIIFKQNV